MSQKKFYVIGYEQNVRSEPVISKTNIVKVVPHNHEIDSVIDMKVYDQDNIWLKYREGWIALVYRGGLYLKQVI